MSRVDVQDLAREDLPRAEFPIDSQEKFRLFLSPSVHGGIQQHAKEDVTVEICGVLVGLWKQDEQGPYAEVQNYIRCDNASSKFAEVTFTHESWSQINQEMDSKYDDSRIIGWYHSHPDFGIFLSDRDCFIQENFFSGPGQIAYVVDPVRDLEGSFAWEQGKPKLLPHYWIGERICTSHSSKRSSTTDGVSGNELTQGESLSSRTSPHESSSFSLATQLLAWSAVFLLGYLGAGWRTSWERQRVIEGTVAHYGIEKVIKLGLQENLSAVQSTLRATSEELIELPVSLNSPSSEQVAAWEEGRIRIVKNLQLVEAALDAISHEYSFSAEERDVLYRLVARKHAEIRRLAQQQAQAREKDAKLKKSVAEEPVKSAMSEEESPPATEPEAPEPEALEEPPLRDANQGPVER